MRSFPRFAGIGGARESAENLAAELTQGSQVPFLSPKQAQDALAIRDLLADLQMETGRRVSAVEAVTGFLAAATPVPVSPSSGRRGDFTFPPLPRASGTERQFCPTRHR